MATGFFLTRWIFEAMRWLYYNVTDTSVVLTIIISTIVLKLITLFSDVASRKHAVKMAYIQPQIDKIQKKYKSDPKRAQQEQSKLMKSEGVGMLAGCLPMLLMMPMFFCFIAAFRHWGYEQMVRMILELSEKGTSTQFDSFKFLWVNNIWQPDNGTVSVIMDAKTFLAIPDLQNLLYFKENPAALETFRALGFLVQDVKNIPPEAIAKYDELVAPIKAVYEGYSNGWFILPVLSAGTNFLMQWIMSKSQPQAATQGGSAKMMLYMMPVMSFVFCLTNNSAFAIYWIINSVLSITVNLILNKKYPRPVIQQQEVQKR